ncbi:MAG: response regulator [Solidesulfovibrio sp. DCME]|uniref:hybrid sensor histidine kinase/response regulator n=1 Tax=Solidesulfovibrio sp. DCME TaxID=3447380 RepID=UPI003D128BAA
MASTDSPASVRTVPGAYAFAWGLAVFAVVGGVAVWVGLLCREALAAVFPVLGAWGLAAIGAGLAALAAALAGFAVDRHLRLRLALRQRDAEVGAARADLLRSNRALTALGAINHELIHAVDRDAFLTSVCEVLVHRAGYDLVWVGMVDPAGGGRVRVAARAGEDAEWLDSLDIRCDGGARAQGPAGTAMREGHLVYVPRFQDEAFFRNWPDRPAAFSRYVSAIALPLRLGGRVVGALTIYERREREFGGEEVALLGQMAADVAHGLHVLRLSASRARAAVLMRQAFRVSTAMAATARALVSGDLDMAGMSGLVLSRAMELTGSSLGTLGLVDRRTGRVDWLVTIGPQGVIPADPAHIRELYPDVAGRFSGAFAPVLNDGLALRHNGQATLDDVCPCFPNMGRVTRFLAVPLRRREGKTGGILLLAEAGEPYLERDLRSTQRLATLLEMGAARLAVEQELDAARRRAEAASQAKTQFLANISHELRTPINGILGMAQLAILEGASGREGEYWQTVRESTDRLVDIVDNLLELASVESGSLSPMLREFSLRRLLDSLRGTYSVRAGLAGLSLECDIDAALPDRLLGDPFRLRQILAHLLDNAIRFTPTGGVTLRARLVDAREAVEARQVYISREFGGLCLAFAVLDTGIGIPKDKQADIFESFALAEECLTKRFGGTGMGLSIASRLAELLGGTIRVESRPGFGSTFSLTIPLWPVADRQAEEGASSAPTTLSPLRILVVEDEAVNRLALARSLRKLGHEVTEADNGEEALRKLSLDRVDVVIMDIQMPVMDGLTAVSHIRNGEVPGVNRRLPVVALTAYALEGDRKRFLAAGMDEFVTKPCDMDQLLRAVAKVVGVRPAG